MAGSICEECSAAFPAACVFCTQAHLSTVIRLKKLTHTTLACGLFRNRLSGVRELLQSYKAIGAHSTGKGGKRKFYCVACYTQWQWEGPTAEDSMSSDTFYYSHVSSKSDVSATR